MAPGVGVIGAFGPGVGVGVGFGVGVGVGVGFGGYVGVGVAVGFNVIGGDVAAGAALENGMNMITRAKNIATTITKFHLLNTK